MAAVAMDFLAEVLAEDGTIRPERLAERLRINKARLAITVGLSRDAVTRRDRFRAPRTQARLRDVIEILDRVRVWAGSNETAFAWYRSAPLPSFGDMTAEDLIKQGRAEAIKCHISRIAAGGYA